MTMGQLRKAVEARPFWPFTILLADGRAFRVRSPEYILLPPEAQRTLIVAESAEDCNIIDLLLVTSIDFNGRSRFRSKKAR